MRNGPVDHTCNASGHWACLWECSHWLALGVLLQCHSSWPDAAVYLHMAGSAVSVQAAAAAIAAAATRDASASLSDATNTYMSLGSDFGLAGLALQAQLRGPPNPAFRDGQPRMSCIYVLGAPPRLHRYKARMVDHPGRLVSERVVNR